MKESRYEKNDPVTKTTTVPDRRGFWKRTVICITSIGLITAAVGGWTRSVWAATRSRTDGYAVQKAEEEWKALLSPMQYYVLRQGGTEQPSFSILDSEDRPGLYRCAACNTILFDAADKFHSGTGWPSFARALQPGVEIDQVDAITATLAGAELRCSNCGSHLGDVFQDGFLFWGTEAAKTGKRYCIDGAALVFYPTSTPSQDHGENANSLFVRGDVRAKPKNELPSWLEPPKIAPRDSKNNV